MNVLVTGGAGFIGSQLTQRLAARGDTVTVIDNLDPFYDPNIKRANVAAFPASVKFVEGDFRDEALVEQLFNEGHFQRVAHMGALANVRASLDKGPLYSDVNTRGSVILMDAARRHGIDQFVLASTSSVYGETKNIPFKEADAPDFPLAPYPASKRSAEIFAHAYSVTFGLNVTSLRFFNVYGPNGRPDMMPLRTIHAILNDETITVFDGGALMRDWTYIEDIIDGVTAAVDRPNGYKIYNLGCGAPLSLTDFITHYEQLIGKKAKVVSAPAPVSEPRVTYCDNSLARAELGFEPKTNIAQGLANTWEWFQRAYLAG